MSDPLGNWVSTLERPARRFMCGYCGHRVSSIRAYVTNFSTKHWHLYICPDCNNPTYFNDVAERQILGVRPGEDVDAITDEGVRNLFNEARDCFATDAYTGSVLCCRKLLMNVAVERGANTGESFAFYVDFLAEEGFVPPGGKDWVHHIREKGNEATHEIPQIDRASAKELIDFSEMLLKFIYEFPARLKKSTGPESDTEAR